MCTMFCSQCGTKAIEDAKFCVECGTTLTANSHPNTIRAPAIPKVSAAYTFKTGTFIPALARGDFGLAKTYWLYGVLVSFVVQIIGEFITSTEPLVLVMGIYIIYMLPVLLGIWRAADVYPGPYVWAVLAKIWVVLGWISYPLGLLAGYGIFVIENSR